MTDFTEADAARNIAKSQGNLASDLSAESATLSDKLGSALRSRLENPLLQQRNEAISNFISMGPTAREDAFNTLNQPGMPANPLAVERLVSQRRATSLLPVMNLSGLYQAQEGGIDDTIQRGTNAFSALVGAQQGRAQIAQQDFSNVMDQLRLQETMRQFNEQQTMAREGAKGFSDMVDLGDRVGILDKNGNIINTLAKGKLPGSGGGDGSFGGWPQQQQTPEPKPTNRPGQNMSPVDAPSYTAKKVGQTDGAYIYTGNGPYGGWDINWAQYGL